MTKNNHYFWRGLFLGAILLFIKLMLLLTTDTEAIEAAERQQAINAEAIAAYRPAKPALKPSYGGSITMTEIDAPKVMKFYGNVHYAKSRDSQINLIDDRLHELRVTEMESAMFQGMIRVMIEHKDQDPELILRITRHILNQITEKESDDQKKIAEEAFVKFESTIREYFKAPCLPPS